jgi:hypothetical protein
MDVQDNMRADGRTMHYWQLRRVLGIPEGRIPRDLEILPAVRVGNVYVWVTRSRGGGHRARHRVMCHCPRCGHTLPAGRLHQHLGTRRCDERLR